MARMLININFYGHADPVVSGKLADDTTDSGTTRRQWKRKWSLDVVGYDDELAKASRKLQVNYNAVLGLNQALKIKEIVDTTIKAAKASAADKAWVLLTGYSSGGLSALYAGREILKRPEVDLYYIGVADAAIDTKDPAQIAVRDNPDIKANYPKNYFQTKGNADDIQEWHGPLQGFTSIDLSQLVGNGTPSDLHEKACKIGNKRMSDDLKWCATQLG